MKKEQPRDEFLRKRAERQRKIRKRRLITTFVVMLIMALCTLVVLSLTVFFPIEKIIVTGSSVYTAEALEKASGVAKGDNLFTASKARIENKLKKDLPYVESVKLERQIPDTLKIIVTDAEEFACYLVGNKYYLVSESGWVLAETAALPEQIMTVTGLNADCKVGSEAIFKDETQNELISRITELCDGEDILINALDISNTVSVKLSVEDRFEVEIGNVNNIEEKIKHLGGMIEEIQEDQGGYINLSMWTEENTQGTFKPGIIE